MQKSANNNNSKIGIFKNWIVFGICLVLFSCVQNRKFDDLQESCTTDILANTTYQELRNLYEDRTLQIQEDLVIEGYVISSDAAGNYFGVLHFQDKLLNPTDGFQIEIDLRDSHLFYPVGSKIAIKLKGLYLGQSKGIYRIGGVFTSFGNISVGRLPAPIVNQHLFVLCEEKEIPIPTSISLNESLDAYVNTRVQFSNLEISDEELGETFAIATEETIRTLLNCQDIALSLVNSGYSNFQNELLPEGSGAIKGILQKENEEYILVINDLNDIAFINSRCEPYIDEFTSTNLFISELADPNNNSGARFIELYNAMTKSLSLKGWTLNRYTNASTTISSSIDLSGNTIGAESTFVISPNGLEFESVYGFAPNLAVGTGGAADSNGDDTIVLVDPFGVAVDIFGQVGTDGTGTNHEFEDGRALRNVTITEANSTYNFAEWQVYNDSGNSGTINMPQNAPGAYSPGIR